MNTNNPKPVIVCDACSHEFDAKKIEFKTAKTKIDGKELEVTFYKCPNCGQNYVISIMDYWGKKLQQQYIDAESSYRKLYHSSFYNEDRMRQKLDKAEQLKDKALSYVKDLLQKYGELLPEEIFR